VETYSFYIEDSRYTVPTLLFVTAAGERMREMAEQKLAESEFHLSVTVWNDDVRLFVVPGEG
jgi:hypothetical protein